MFFKKKKNDDFLSIKIEKLIDLEDKLFDYILKNNIFKKIIETK